MFPVSRIVYITLTCRAVLIKLDVTVLAFPFTVIGMLDAWPDNVRFHGNRFRCSVSLSFCAQFLNITLTMQELQSVCVRTMVVLEATGIDSVRYSLLSCVTASVHPIPRLGLDQATAIWHFRYWMILSLFKRKLRGQQSLISETVTLFVCSFMLLALIKWHYWSRSTSYKNWQRFYVRRFIAAKKGRTLHMSHSRLTQPCVVDMWQPLEASQSCSQ